MPRSFIRSLLVGLLLIAIFAGIIEFISFLFPIFIRFVLAVATLAFLLWFFSKEYNEHKYYIQHVKPSEDSYNNAMRDYWKACRRDSWIEVKKSWSEVWTELRGGKKKTP